VIRASPPAAPVGSRVAVGQGQVLIEVHGTGRKGVEAGRHRCRSGGFAGQGYPGRRRSGARVTEHGQKQGRGSQQQQSGTRHGSRGLLQHGQDRADAFTQAATRRRGTGGGGKGGLAFGE